MCAVCLFGGVFLGGCEFGLVLKAHGGGEGGWEDHASLKRNGADTDGDTVKYSPGWSENSNLQL